MRERLDAFRIVARTVGAVLVGSDVDGDDAALALARFKPRQRGGMSAIVEAEAVDQGAVADEAEDARLRISRLRSRRHGADLGEAATHREHGVGSARILVVACGDADRVREFQAEHLLTEHVVIRAERTRMQAAFERLDGRFVRVFRIEREQGGPSEPIKRVQHTNHSS